MTGKDLFRAMEYVDDELVNEAEEKTWTGKKRRPLAKQWYALAACLCVLVISLTAVSVYTRTQPKSGGSETDMAAQEAAGGAQAGSMEAGAAGETTEQAPEGSAGATAGVAESETAVSKEEMAETTETADAPAEAADKETKLSDAAEDAGNGAAGGKTEAAVPPRAGEVLLEDPVTAALAAHSGEDVRYLLVFDLYSGQNLIVQDSVAYQNECERLQKAGLAMREISGGTDAENKTAGERKTAAWLLTGEQLAHFPADEKYGYYIRFVSEEGGSEIPRENNVITGAE